MARIRTIKPEFWTDETITECSLTARLLFIGIWNFADDNGNIERSSKQMKMKIFPADNLEIEPLVLELMAIGLLIEYEFNGCKYLNIRGFTKHQVINRPSKTGHPKYNESMRTHTPLTEDYRTEGKGREGKGKETTKNNNSTAEKIMEVVEERYSDLERLFPKINRDVSIAKLVNRFKDKPPPIDIYETVLKWLQNEFPAAKISAEDKQVVYNEILDHNTAVCQRFAEAST